MTPSTPHPRETQIRSVCLPRARGYLGKSLRCEALMPRHQHDTLSKWRIFWPLWEDSEDTGAVAEPLAL